MYDMTVIKRIFKRLGGVEWDDAEHRYRLFFDTHELAMDAAIEAAGKEVAHG